MTHDELLTKLSSSQVFGKQFGAKAYLALRAVVELHKPDTRFDLTCKNCGIQSQYPCPTIQEIEKAMK